MKKQSLTVRFLYPLALGLGLWAVSSFLYNYAGYMRPGSLRNMLINVFGPLLFLSVWFYALLGVPLAYFRGARFLEKFIIAFANPTWWVARVLVQVSCQYNPIELVYFFFLPWTFGIMCVALFELALADLICRFVHRRRRPGAVRVFHPGVVFLLLAGLSGTYVGLIRGQEWVYQVVHHYAANVLK
ncbi:MAG: hypothetical protein AB1641_26675 [Thermodesulfobacteriota bacterium]